MSNPQQPIAPTFVGDAQVDTLARQVRAAAADLYSRLAAATQAQWMPLDSYTLHAWPCDDPFYALSTRGVLRDLGSNPIPMTLYDEMGQTEAGLVLPRALHLGAPGTMTYCYADTNNAPNDMASAKGSGWAISAWIRKWEYGAATPPNKALIIGYIDNAGTVNFALYVDGQYGRPYAIATNTVSGYQQHVADYVIDGGWHHVAVAYVENTPRYYVIVDGEIVAGGGFNAADQINWTAGAAPRRWFIGYPTAAYGCFTVQDVRVHATSRLSRDPASVVRTGSTGTTGDLVGVADYWVQYWRRGMGLPLFTSYAPVTP
jgi:hypothetical protein